MRKGVVGPGHRRNPRVWPAAGRRGGGCLRHRRAKIRWKTLGRQVEDGLRPDSHTRAVSGVRCPMERRVCPRLMQRWAGKQTVVHQSLRGQTIHNRFCVHFDFRSTEFFLQVSGGVVTHRPLRQLAVPPVRWRVGGGWGRPRRGGQTRCARPPRGAPPSTPTRPTPLASAPARTGTCGPADAAVDAAARHASPVPRHAGPVPRHARPVSRHQPRRGGKGGGPSASAAGPLAAQRTATRGSGDGRPGLDAEKARPWRGSAGEGGGRRWCAHPPPPPPRRRYTNGWTCQAGRRRWRWPPHAPPPPIPLFLSCLWPGRRGAAVETGRFPLPRDCQHTGAVW